ncbi:MAG: hypothetical protein ABFD07_14615 [Methanobacterium sp.]
MKGLSDYQIGEYAVKKFHIENNTNFLNWYSVVSNKIGKTKLDAQISGLGLGIRFVGLSKTKVDDYMKDFSDQARGRIPANVSEFTSAIQDQASVPTFVSLDFFKEVVGQTIIDTAGKAIDITANVGTVLTNTVSDVVDDVSFILKYKWWILAGLGIGGAMLIKYTLNNSDKIAKVASAVKPFR